MRIREGLTAAVGSEQFNLVAQKTFSLSFFLSNLQWSSSSLVDGGCGSFVREVVMFGVGMVCIPSRPSSLFPNSHPYSTFLQCVVIWGNFPEDCLIYLTAVVEFVP